MSEKFKSQHESEAKNNEALEKAARERLDEIIEKGKDAPHNNQEKLEDARQEAKAEARSRDELLDQRDAKEKDEPQAIVNSELKGMAYQRTLNRVRKDLSAPERAFSKVIHNKTIESVSEVASKTVARPSGILAGGIVAFLGSSTFLWLTKHYGYEYNFLLLMMFFVAGFALGLLIELFIRSGQKLKK